MGHLYKARWPNKTMVQPRPGATGATRKTSVRSSAVHLCRYRRHNPRAAAIKRGEHSHNSSFASDVTTSPHRCAHRHETMAEPPKMGAKSLSLGGIALAQFKTMVHDGRVPASSSSMDNGRRVPGVQQPPPCSECRPEVRIRDITNRQGAARTAARRESAGPRRCYQRPLGPPRAAAHMPPSGSLFADRRRGSLGLITALRARREHWQGIGLLDERWRCGWTHFPWTGACADRGPGQACANSASTWLLARDSRRLHSRRPRRVALTTARRHIRALTHL